MKGRQSDHNWINISETGELTVKGSFDRGYAWDGCSPKFNFLNIVWGTPDGAIHKFGSGDYKPRTYYASMCHDVLYQYKKCIPVTRKEADYIFYLLMKESGFKLRHLYYAAVRLVGWAYGDWTYKATKK